MKRDFWNGVYAAIAMTLMAVVFFIIFFGEHFLGGTLLEWLTFKLGFLFSGSFIALVWIFHKVVTESRRN